MFLCLHGYFGQIESDYKIVPGMLFHLHFSSRVQRCVGVIAFNFQVIIRKSGGSRTFGSNIHLLAGPARAIDTSFIE